MDLGVPSELYDDRFVNAIGVVFDVVAIYRYGVLEVTIRDGYDALRAPG